jgi:y4mF family transcriptional regulator
VNIEDRFEFGETIRRRRQSLGITQSTLADLSGVGRHSITDIESGKGNPTIEITKRLLAPLGLKLVIQIAEPGHSQDEVIL